MTIAISAQSGTDGGPVCGYSSGAATTVEIAERCNVDLGMTGYHLPLFEVPEGYTVPSYLRMLCDKGLERKYGSRAQDAEVQERLEYELGVINEMGFDAYFLITWDLCRHATDLGIWYTRAVQLPARWSPIPLTSPMWNRSVTG